MEKKQPEEQALKMLLFCVEYGKLTRKEQRRRDEIAKRISGEWGKDIDFYYIDDPGEGWKSWFSAPNRGAPFDAEMAEDVQDALAEKWEL